MEDINWLAFSFVVEQENGEETQIAYCSKQVAPRKGEYIWMPYNWERKEKFKTRSFLVENVAHHINPNHKNGSYDNIVVYCKPMMADEGNTTD